MDEILKSDHSNTESYWAVRPYETVYYAVQGGFNIWDWEWHAKAASIFYTAYQTDHNLQGWGSSCTVAQFFLDTIFFMIRTPYSLYFSLQRLLCGVIILL